MSSSIDWFDCPKCGGDYTAHREQDNRTCEIYYGCSNCDWTGETIIDDGDDVRTIWYPV